MFQDARNFKYSSDYAGPFIVYKNDKLEIKALGRGTTTTKVAHGLGFAPLLAGVWSASADFNAAQDISSGSGIDNTSLRVFADDTYIYCNLLAAEAKTRYVKLIGFMNPEYNGDSGTISTESTFNLDSDNEYIGIAKQGVAEEGEYFVEHDLGYAPLCKVWNVTNDYEYIGNYPYGSGSSRSPITNVLYPMVSTVTLRKDGRYELYNATSKEYLGFTAYYNPENGQLEHTGYTTGRNYYHIYTEEA